MSNYYCSFSRIFYTSSFPLGIHPYFPYHLSPVTDHPVSFVALAEKTKNLSVTGEAANHKNMSASTILFDDSLHLIKLLFHICNQF